MFPRREHPIFAFCIALCFACLLVSTTFFLLSSSQATHAQSQPEALGSLSGTVTDAQGQPLAGIDVSLEFYPSSSPQQVRNTTSDAVGRYSFPSLYPGTYAIRFIDPTGVLAEAYYKNGVQNEEATAVMVSGNTVENIDVQMTRGGSINVTIQNTEALTIQRFIGTLYRQRPSGRWANYRIITQITPHEQAISFTGLPFGTYRFCGSFTATSTISQYWICYDGITQYDDALPVNTATNIVIEDTTPRQITLDPYIKSQLQGHLITAKGEPVPNIPILASNSGFYAAAISDEQGFFRFTYLPDGKYQLFVSDGSMTNRGKPHGNWLSTYYPNTFNYAEAQRIEIDASSRLSISYELIPGGIITGFVKLPNDVPLINPLFQLTKGYFSDNDLYCHVYQTCSNITYDPTTGHYTFTNLPPAQYYLRVTERVSGANSRITKFYGADIPPYEPQPITVITGHTVSNINLVLGEQEFNAIITGTVTVNGVGQPGIEVRLQESTSGVYFSPPLLTTLTDQQGNYSLENLAAGYYTISALDPQGRYAHAYHKQKGQSSIYPNTIRLTGSAIIPNVNITMTQAGTIRGRILTPKHELPADYHVVAVNAAIMVQGYHATMTPLSEDISDQEGFYELTGLDPEARYVVGAIVPENSYFSRQVIRYYGDINYDPYEATTLTVQAGQVTPEINITFGHPYQTMLPSISAESAVLR